jgi:hypothetical protein
MKIRPVIQLCVPVLPQEPGRGGAMVGTADASGDAGNGRGLLLFALVSRTPCTQEGGTRSPSPFRPHKVVRADVLPSPLQTLRGLYTQAHNNLRSIAKSAHELDAVSEDAGSEHEVRSSPNRVHIWWRVGVLSC